MTLTPDQLDEAKQLLGLEQESTLTSAATTADTTTAGPGEVATPEPDVADEEVSIYCPNCSHLLAKVSK